ncbi:hypothetical protein ACIBG8_01655 [Nonomuraea sp. NPDC050556]|uniref:hypothetical protein n=1 Tax=Nonomuraea sp. NPDC050556 TaxID=3364369 RepID=UPI00379CB134
MGAEQNQPEGVTPAGQPEVRTTPRDVVHLRLGSFALVGIVVIGALGLLAGITWLSVVMAVLAVVVVVDMVLALRRQSRARGTTEAG